LIYNSTSLQIITTYHGLPKYKSEKPKHLDTIDQQQEKEGSKQPSPGWNEVIDYRFIITTPIQPKSLLIEFCELPRIVTLIKPPPMKSISLLISN
jgi:hypothetical protein